LVTGRPFSPILHRPRALRTSFPTSLGTTTIPTYLLGPTIYCTSLRSTTTHRFFYVGSCTTAGPHRPGPYGNPTSPFLGPTFYVGPQYSVPTVSFLQGLWYQSVPPMQAYNHTWPGLTIIFQSASGLHMSARHLFLSYFFGLFQPGTSVPKSPAVPPLLCRIGPTLLAHLPHSSCHNIFYVGSTATSTTPGRSCPSSTTGPR